MSPRRRSTRHLLRAAALCGAAAVLLGSVPRSADAQVRRGRAVQSVPRWAPVAIGVRYGWDQPANGHVFGAQVRIPVLRSGKLELVPNADVVSLRGAKEYQYAVTVDFLPAGPRGGLFIGGGVGWRDSVLGATLPTDPRATYFGYIFSFGGKSAIGPVQLEANLRWVFLDDTDFRPSPATLGVNYPLWRVAPER